jgi:WD40 repeat protein
VIDAFDLEVVVGVEEATAGLDLSKEAADPPKWPVLSTKFQSQSHRSGVTCTSFNRDGTLVLSASEDGAVKITEVNRMVNRSGDLPPALRVFQAEGNVHSLALHPFATVFAAGSRDSVAIFNYNKPDVKKPTRVLPFGFTPTSLAFHPTGDYLLAGGEPGKEGKPLYY